MIPRGLSLAALRQGLIVSVNDDTSSIVYDNNSTWPPRTVGLPRDSSSRNDQSLTIHDDNNNDNVDPYADSTAIQCYDNDDISDINNQFDKKTQ